RLNGTADANGGDRIVRQTNCGSVWIIACSFYRARREEVAVHVERDLIAPRRAIDRTERLNACGGHTVIADRVVAEVIVAGGEFLAVAAIFVVDVQHDLNAAVQPD